MMYKQSSLMLFAVLMWTFYLGFCQSTNTRRKLTRLQQDVNFLRDQAVDLRHDIDEIFIWRNVTFGNLPFVDTVQMIDEAENDDVGEDPDLNVLIPNAETVNKIQKKVDYIIKGLAEEKMAIRGLLDYVKAEVHEEMGRMRSSVIDSTVREVKQVREDVDRNMIIVDEKVANLGEDYRANEERSATRIREMMESVKADVHNQNVRMREAREESKSNNEYTLSVMRRLEAEFRKLEKETKEACRLVGWIQYKTSFYKRFDERHNFSDAEESCKKQGANLVEITHPGEMKFLHDTFGDKYYWLGATDLNVEGEWKWLSGSKVEETHWVIEPPNNDADCIQSGEAFGEWWYDFDCSDVISYVCKI